MRTAPVLLLATALSGCANLDSFAWNPIHCSEIDQQTCTGYDNDWDNVCKACDEPYDWQKDYPWMPGTLDAGESVRPVQATRVQQLTLPSEDGEAELDAYWIASHGGDPALAGVTVVYNHGNFANIEHYAPRVRFLHEAGYNVLVWDYRGYGKTEPAQTPSAEQHFADARLVLDEAIARAPDPSRIVVYGYSIGSLSATEMAVQDKVCALILEAPFVSIATTTEANTTVSMGDGFLSRGGWDNLRRMQGHTGPVLGMIGELDSSFRPEDAERLVNTTSGPTDFWLVPEARHGVSTGGVPEVAGLDPYFQRMRGFLDDVGCL